LSDITAAVESRDAEKARLLMQRHVYKFNRLAEEGQRKKSGDRHHE
jgi:DNA-binding GntR family transcriptional regulator